MKTYKRASTITSHINNHKKKGLSVGFIPTMGALHYGHLSLVEASVKHNDITVVSIFVNPTQFNQKEDLLKYPRNLKADEALLKSAGVDYIFAPAVSQIYPKGLKTNPEIYIDRFIERMEGPNRPGHFEGVVQVVYRLLQIIPADKIYMGQKDYQQFSIIQHMLSSLKMDTKLVVCPIIRRANGLAMSSRNQRLSARLKQEAGIIHSTLDWARANLGKLKVHTLEKRAMERLSTKAFKPEYFEIIDGLSFKRVTDPDLHSIVVACTAVWAKDVRLIDNMILKGQDLLYQK